MREKVDLSVELAGVTLKNPVAVASGTFGFGREYGQFFDLSALGAICCKGLTLHPREGNPPPRIAETPLGMLNSVGLQNPGVDAFIRDELPFLRQFDVKVIANISGNTPEEYGVMCEKLSEAGVDMIEVNISCPNVKAGGLAYGTRPDLAAEVTAEAKRHARVPVMVKLSPNVTDITEIAKAAADAGADALSLINTLRGMRIDVNTRRPILKMNTGGLSGPAVLPVAVRMVWEVASAVKLPILGMGGVATGEDAAQLMLAGASAVAVGTALFADPCA
ncbi:MAG: dihydroorotate dehydrogenase, partial [Oscillospiraceae bacterium]|nr:dihydroorotate dehydrogenase [Oscillospiraceae bacterium]